MSCCNHTARRGATKRGTFVRGDSPLPRFVQLDVFTVLRIMRIHFKVLFLYDGKSGCLAFIQSCCFFFPHQTLLPSVCDMGPVVVIKPLLCAYKNPAAGAFYHIAQPAIKSDLPLRSEGKKRANAEPLWAPGTCVSGCVCLRSRVREGGFPPWSADLLAALGLRRLQKPVFCTFFYLKNGVVDILLLNKAALP